MLANRLNQTDYAITRCIVMCECDAYVVNLTASSACIRAQWDTQEIRLIQFFITNRDATVTLMKLNGTFSLEIANVP